MTIFAATCFAHPGNHSYGTYLCIFEDNTLIHKIRTELSEFSTYAGSTSIVISADEEFVAFTRTITPYLTRVVKVTDGTWVDVPELKNANPHGPANNVVQWSPRRKVFVSGHGDYAYNPYKNQVIPLPGPTATAKYPWQTDIEMMNADGFSVLAQEELLIECMPLGLAESKETYPIVVKNLFTGAIVPTPKGMGDYPYAAIRPCAWRDNTGIAGLIYRGTPMRYTIQNPLSNYFNYLTAPESPRIINTITGFKHVFSKGLQFGFVSPTPNGALFQTYSSGNSSVILVSDAGDVTQLKTELGFPTSPYPSARVSVIYNNTLFSAFNTVSIGSPPAGLSLVGGAPSNPPTWFTSVPAWEGLLAIGMGSAASPSTYRDPIGRDGEFWTNRRYANETFLYE